MSTSAFVNITKSFKWRVLSALGIRPYSPVKAYSRKIPAPTWWERIQASRQSQRAKNFWKTNPSDYNALQAEMSTACSCVNGTAGKSLFENYPPLEFMRRFKCYSFTKKAKLRTATKKTHGN